MRPRLLAALLVAAAAWASGGVATAGFVEPPASTGWTPAGGGLRAATSVRAAPSAWRHPLCANSTAGRLAAHCGHTFIGRPCPSRCGIFFIRENVDRLKYVYCVGGGESEKVR